MKSTNKTPQTMDEYIQAFPAPVQKRLTEIRTLVRALTPGVKEKISYGIPTFYLKRNLVHFAGYAKHIGFYPGASGIEAFEAELGGYKHAKGSVQFPIDAPLPVDLITRMVQFRVGEESAAP